MSILFNGYYGYLNTGDDIFGVISDWGARKFWGEESISFLGNQLPHRYDNSILKSSYTSSIRFKGKDALEAFKGGLINKKVIYAGGSVFSSKIDGFSKNNIFKILNLFRALEIGAIGVSVGPYHDNTARESIKRYLSQFSFISLRDKRSFYGVQEMNLNIPVAEAFDLAALLPELYPINKKHNVRPILGISICNYESYTGKDTSVEKKRTQDLFATVKQIIKRVPDLHLKIFVFNAHPVFGDLQISNQLISELPKEVLVERIDYDPNPYYMWNEVASCNAVLATRLHAGMFACFSNTPFLQIEYHQKCSDFLSDIAYPNDFKIGDIEISPTEVTDRLIRLLEFKGTFIPNKKLMQDKALLNFTSFKDFF